MTDKNIVLLDGGMGQELVRRSGRQPTPMWAAQVMLDQPDIVRDLHIDFIQSGALVITLNAYSSTPERLQRDGAAEMFKPLQKAAIDVAKEARDRAAVDGVRIAGCLGPLVTSYRPELAPDLDTMLATYRSIVAEQADDVDLFLCETMASVNEASAAAMAATECGKPVWVGMTVADDQSGNLRSGEVLADAWSALDEIGVQAYLINCSQPESISAGFHKHPVPSGAWGAYANGFTSIDKLGPGGTVDVLEARADLDPEQYAQIAMQWVDSGATVVGGCCEVGPAHIATLAEKLGAAGYTLTGELA